jgi:hypothetical protein
MGAGPVFDALVTALGGSFTRAPWGWGVLAMMIAGYIKIKPAMIRLKNEREASLLEERAQEMAAMRERLEKLEAERAVDRHRLNNVTTCLDALLLLLETAPEKAAEHVARIKQMRTAQMAAEAAEKGAIHGAAIGKAALS